MKLRLAAALAATILATPVRAGDIHYPIASPYPERDSGIGSYSNVYGDGWVKVCCDYPYYRPYPRFRRPHHSKGDHHHE